MSSTEVENDLTNEQYLELLEESDPAASPITKVRHRFFIDGQPFEVDIYCCPDCRKVEFFLAEEEEIDEELPQKQCPKCGKMHDFDYPKCPFCKYDYYA